MLKTVDVLLTKLKEDPQNARLHPDENISDIRASLLLAARNSHFGRNRWTM